MIAGKSIFSPLVSYYNSRPTLEALLFDTDIDGNVYEKTNSPHRDILLSYQLFHIPVRGIGEEKIRRRFVCLTYLILNDGTCCRALIFKAFYLISMYRKT